MVAGTYTSVAWSGILEARKIIGVSTEIVNRMECARLLTIREYEIQLEKSPIPKCILLSGDGAFPALQIQCPLGGALGFRDKPERVVTSPLLPVRAMLVSAFLAGVGSFDLRFTALGEITYRSSWRRFRQSADISCIGVDDLDMMEFRRGAELAEE